METGVLSTLSVPCTEVISQVIEAIIEIGVAANDVLVKKDSFQQLAAYLDRIATVLKELNKKTHCHSQSLMDAIKVVNQEAKAAKILTQECGKRNKVYLLMNCRRVVKQLEDTMRRISHALGLLPLASLDLSTGIIEEIGQLRDNMQRVEFKAAVAEEEILEKVDFGIVEGNANRLYANNLLSLIADAVGISKEKSDLKKEFEQFKNEIENVRLRKDEAEAIQMDQIIALLERADAASSPREKEIKYLRKRKSLGSQPLEPLQSFYCPITREVMVDPVETSSGQTFERSAIENWFKLGHSTCPLTSTPLDTTYLRPNKTLRRSIEEWKDRNTMITIASIKPKLSSEEEEEIVHCLEKLEDLCEQRDVHREWLILENYIPTLLELLGKKNRSIRTHALTILCILAKDSDDAKERIAKVDNAVESIVPILARRIGERKLAVALLLELSKMNFALDCIGKVQGCILLLVTMSNCEDSEAARDAQKLLENLSFSDQNVIQMAKANYFTHFLQRLSTGSEEVKMTMAKALAEMELSDHNKESLCEKGASSSLLTLISSCENQMKGIVVKALKNLSSVEKNGLQMIREGALGPLLDILFHHGSSSTNLREEAAAVIMHLAMSTVSQESSQIQLSLLNSKEEVFRLYSLINMTVPNVQDHIIQTFYALSSSPSASFIKDKLIELSAIQGLVRLCELENFSVRRNALKLLYCLVEDGDKASILEQLDQRCIDTLFGVIKCSNDDEDIAFALGIISYLPEGPQITRWLLDVGALNAITSFLPQNGTRYNPHKHQVLENAIGAICQLTIPENQESQKRAAEVGIIPVLVQLLSSGTNLTKQRAAVALNRFAVSSPMLSKRIRRRKGYFCFSAAEDANCPIHGGICTIESSFCLVEADAVAPLVRVLAGPDSKASEASLDALLTLIDGEMLQSGSKILAEANAIPHIIKCLSSPSPEFQQKALYALERIFRQVEFTQKYGVSAHMSLVNIIQHGSSDMKSLAARILAHLNQLPEQSSFLQ